MGYEWVPLLLATLCGIDAHEVRQVLEDNRPRWPRPALGSTGMPMLAIWGRTRAGRRLIVMLRPTQVSHDWQIVGALEMTPEQVVEFDQWEANHDQ